MTADMQKYNRKVGKQKEYQRWKIEKNLETRPRIIINKIGALEKENREYEFLRTEGDGFVYWGASLSPLHMGFKSLTLRHIIIKFCHSKDKEKILNTSRGEKKISL